VGGGVDEAKVLLGCALGRLGVDRVTGELSVDLHCLLCDDLSTSSTVIDAKKARSHLKAIMRKGGHKLTGGKRLRLRNDEDGYDVHILADRLDEISPPSTLVLFVLTVPNFNRYYNIATVLRELKAAVYSAADPSFLCQTKASATSANRAVLLPAFQRVSSQFGRSPLATAETKVAQVKDIMAASVSKALHGVEHLEDMEESSERFEEQSKQFHKKATLVKKQHKKNFWVLGLLIAIIVIAVALYFIIPAAIGSSSSSSSTPNGSSSSTAGAG
jgi:hypothetical protein